MVIHIDLHPLDGSVSHYYLRVPLFRDLQLLRITNEINATQVNQKKSSKFLHRIFVSVFDRHQRIQR